MEKAPKFARVGDSKMIHMQRFLDDGFNPHSKHVVPRVCKFDGMNTTLLTFLSPSFS